MIRSLSTLPLTSREPSLTQPLESQRSAGRLPEGPDLPVAALALAGACQNAVWVGMVNGADGLPYGGKDLAAKLADGLLAQLGGVSS